MTSLAESIPTLESLILKAKNTFQKEYGSSNDGIVLWSCSWPSKSNWRTHRLQ